MKQKQHQFFDFSSSSPSPSSSSKLDPTQVANWASSCSDIPKYFSPIIMSKGVTGKVLLTLDYPALESIGVLEFQIVATSSTTSEV